MATFLPCQKPTKRTIQEGRKKKEHIGDLVIHKAIRFGSRMASSVHLPRVWSQVVVLFRSGRNVRV